MEKLIVRPDYQNLASGIDFEPMNKSKMKKLMDNALKAFTENRVEEAKLMIHEIISYNPNSLKMYFVLIELYLDDKDINQAKNLIDTLNLKSMKGEIVFSDEDYSTLTQLKYRRFEIEENMNS
ncbi:MAG: tetratricopeptide repeat protein [Balneola sp.]